MDAGQHEHAPGSPTILVVDDEKNVRLLVAAILGQVGYTVLAASDGHEGVSLFREHAPDIVAVILDMMLPQMPGQDVYRELRRIREDVPIIFSSGFEPTAVTEFAGAEHYLTDFIQKPYQPATLVDKIRQMVGAVRRAPGLTNLS